MEELKWRNLIQDVTPGIEDYINNGMAVGYIGFDPTAPSLGLGNYVQISLLSFFQMTGNKPIVVMGGATGRIGDPSGKDKERELKSIEEIQSNIDRQVEQFKKFLNFDEGPNAAVLVNNFDFYRNMNVLDFLRDVGKSMTVNYMLSKESVRKRMETGISYTEFSYQLVQAYDYYCLYRDYACRLQMGGSDQWGNIVSGIDYIGRNISGSRAYAITTPLLTKSDGKKFGKTEEGNVWLDPQMTSPYKFYQFWLNADDNDLSRLFRYFSFRTQEEILSLEDAHRNDPRILKQELAEEITTRIHGAESFERVLRVSQLLFSKDCSIDFLQGLQDNDYEAVGVEIPGYEIQRHQLDKNPVLSDFLTEVCPIFKSKTEVRNAVQNNAISINKSKISDAQMVVNETQFIRKKYLMLENGKKNKYLIKLS